MEIYPLLHNGFFVIQGMDNKILSSDHAQPWAYSNYDTAYGPNQGGAPTFFNFLKKRPNNLSLPATASATHPYNPKLPRCLESCNSSFLSLKSHHLSIIQLSNLALSLCHHSHPLFVLQLSNLTLSLSRNSQISLSLSSNSPISPVWETEVGLAPKNSESQKVSLSRRRNPNLISTHRNPNLISVSCRRNLNLNTKS